MRRLVIVLIAAVVLAGGCKRRDRVLVEATEEEGLSLASVVHVADPRVAPQLVRGFHDVEQNSWRWTMGKFSVTLRPPAGAAAKGATLQLKFSVPEIEVKKLGAMTLRANVGSLALTPETYIKPGEQTYVRDVPGSALTGDAVAVDFVLDKFLPPGELDPRELGVIATTVGFEAK